MATKPELTDFSSVPNLPQFNPRVGWVVEITKDDAPLVDFPGNPGAPVLARILDVGSLSIELDASNLPLILLVFENGDLTRPIILGCVRDKVKIDDRIGSERPQSLDVTLNGCRFDFNATQMLALTCGKASITLGHDGKIILKGVNIVSRAAANNKIKGTRVEIN